MQHLWLPTKTVADANANAVAGARSPVRHQPHLQQVQEGIVAPHSGLGGVQPPVHDHDGWAIHTCTRSSSDGSSRGGATIQGMLLLHATYMATYTACNSNSNTPEVQDAPRYITCSHTHNLPPLSPAWYVLVGVYLSC